LLATRYRTSRSGESSHRVQRTTHQLAGPPTVAVVSSLVVFLLGAVIGWAPTVQAGTNMLHVELEAPLQAEFEELTISAARAHLGDQIALSARLVDALSREPLENAVVQFALVLDPDYQTDALLLPQQPAQPSTRAITDASGWTEVTLDLLGDMIPGPYRVTVSGPMTPVGGQSYDTTSATLSDALEVCDQTSLTLKVVTDEDGKTTVSGRLSTVNGLPVRLPLTISVDGRVREWLQPGNLGYEWSIWNLRARSYTFEVECRGNRYLDPTTALVNHHPHRQNWEVMLSTPTTDLVLPETSLLLSVSVTGDKWPPVGLSLSFDATGPDGEITRLGTQPGTQPVILAELEIPKVPGNYFLTAVVSDPEMDTVNLVNANTLQLTVRAPTTVSLERVKGPNGTFLEGTVTSLGQPLEGQPWKVSLDSVVFAEGLTDAAGAFRVDAPLEPGVYEASFDPPEGSFLLPSVSQTVRIISWEMNGAVVTVLAGMAVVGLGFMLARRVRVQRRSREDEGATTTCEDDDFGPTEGELTFLSPQERIIRIYEDIAVRLLGRVVAPKPSEGQWRYLGRVKQTLPRAAGLLRRLLLLYQEARYSLHGVSEDQARQAWRLAQGLRLVVARSEVSAP